MKIKGIFDELQKEMQQVDELSCHNGYWYSVSNALIILVAGALCGIQSIKYIHQWAESEPAQQFLQEVFGIDFFRNLKCTNLIIANTRK